MEKAFSLKALEEKLKEKGFPVLEQGAVEAINAVFEWIDESIDQTETKYDNFLKPASHVLKEFILNKVAHISSSPVVAKSLSAPKAQSDNGVHDSKESEAKEAPSATEHNAELGTAENPIVRASPA